MTTPEAGRLRQLGQCAVELRVGENIYYCTLEPHEHNWHQFSLDADALAALTTQAETIRQCDKELAEFREDLFKQAETIRRLEGELHTRAEQIAARYHERHCVYRQRAEAAEGLLRELRHQMQMPGLDPAFAATMRRMIDKVLTPSPATGEGA